MPRDASVVRHGRRASPGSRRGENTRVRRAAQHHPAEVRAAAELLARGEVAAAERLVHRLRRLRVRRARGGHRKRHGEFPGARLGRSVTHHRQLRRVDPDLRREGGAEGLFVGGEGRRRRVEFERKRQRHDAIATRTGGELATHGTLGTRRRRHDQRRHRGREVGNRRRVRERHVHRVPRPRKQITGDVERRRRSGRRRRDGSVKRDGVRAIGGRPRHHRGRVSGGRGVHGEDEDVRGGGLVGGERDGESRRPRARRARRAARERRRRDVRDGGGVDECGGGGGG